MSVFNIYPRPWSVKDGVFRDAKGRKFHVEAENSLIEKLIVECVNASRADELEEANKRIAELESALLAGDAGED
jgi:hypothetical protein